MLPSATPPSSPWSPPPTSTARPSTPRATSRSTTSSTPPTPAAGSPPPSPPLPRLRGASPRAPAPSPPPPPPPRDPHRLRRRSPASVPHRQEAPEHRHLVAAAQRRPRPCALQVATLTFLRGSTRSTATTPSSSA